MIPVRADKADLAELVAHARRVRERLHTEGRRLTRRELATRLRAEGRSVSNDRATVLVRALQAEAARAHPTNVRLARARYDAGSGDIAAASEREPEAIAV